MILYGCKRNGPTETKDSVLCYLNKSYIVGVAMVCIDYSFLQFVIIQNLGAKKGLIFEG